MAKTKNPELEERRRAQVMATVQRLMTESSCHEMTMDKVAQEAGVSKGLINYYFANKDDLIIQTIRAYHAREAEVLFGIVHDDSRSVRERLQLLVEALFPSREAVEGEMSFQGEVRSFSKSNPEVQKAVRESYRNFRVACEGILRKGIQEGYVRREMSEEDVRWTYLFFHSMISGLTFHVATDDTLELQELRERLLSHLDHMVGPSPTL